MMGENDKPSISAIIASDDLPSFKRLCLMNTDLNRSIYPGTHLVAARKNKRLQYYVPDDVTPINYAILCHARKILKFLVDERNTTFNGRSGGKLPIHNAAMVSDHRIIRTLLRAPSVLDTINEPVDSSFKGFTTAFHIAVSNKRLMNALHLLNASMNLESGGISFMQPSSHGSTPLYIATKTGDLQMVQLILACYAEIGDDDMEERGRLAELIQSPEIKEMLLHGEMTELPTLEQIMITANINSD